MKNLIVSDGVPINLFDVAGEWTAGGSGVLQGSDTSNYVEGTAALKLTATSGPVYTTNTISLDLSSATVFSLWVNVYDLSKLDSFTFYISSSSSWIKYFSLSISTSKLVSGWNHLVLDPNVFTNYNGESWANTMVRLRFRMTPTSGASTSLGFDDLTYNLQAKANCVITIDDGDSSCYLNAKPIMDANNQRGVVFIPTSFVGKPTKMTLSQLKEIYDEGWDISDHTQDHAELNNLTSTALDAQINGAYNWLVANGFDRSAKFFAYPLGDGFDNVTVVNKIKENHILARSVKWDTYQALLTPSVSSPQYALKGYNVFNTTLVASVQAAIDETINQKGLLILIIHGVFNSGPNPDKYACLTADFQKISNYLASKSDGIDVVTFSDLVTSGDVNTDVTVKFATSGMSGDASGTVLTIDSTAYTFTQLQSLTFSWTPGSTHTVTASDLVAAGSGKQYKWNSWTNPSGLTINGGSGGKPGGTFTVPSSPTKILANFIPQYQVIFSINPSDSGTTTPSNTGVWMNSGSNPISATPKTGYKFLSWSSNTVSITFSSSGLASTSAAINGPGTITANFVPTSSMVSITITSSKSGVGFVNVDGVVTSTPVTFSWVAGSIHALKANSPVSGGNGIQYTYTGWSDGGGQTHSYTVPSTSALVTANYKIQYLLSVSSANGSPMGAGWYDSGKSAAFSVTSPIISGSGTRYVSTGYSGSASGSGISGTVKMSGPKSITFSWKTQYKLTVNVVPSTWSATNIGVSPSSTSTPNEQGSVYYWFDQSTAVTLTNKGFLGFRFVGWSGDASSTSTTTTLKMSGPKTAIATYIK